VAHSHTPRNRCVRFVFGVAAASRNTRFQAARYGLTWAGLAPADRISFAGAFPHSITSSARASSVGGTSRPSALRAAKATLISWLVLALRTWISNPVAEAADCASLKVVSKY
jgi:hypothetical protein